MSNVPRKIYFFTAESEDGRTTYGGTIDAPELGRDITNAELQREIKFYTDGHPYTARFRLAEYTRSSERVIECNRDPERIKTWHKRNNRPE